jgi:hypothetical protein
MHAATVLDNTAYICTPMHAFFLKVPCVLLFRRHLSACTNKAALHSDMWDGVNVIPSQFPHMF